MNILILIILVLDQITKILAVDYLKDRNSIHLIGEFLNLTYVENKGAAFGILENKQIFFIIMTVVIIVFIMYFKRYNKDKITKPLAISLNLILAGAIGNLIDRTIHSYVIDFIDVRFGSIYNFPVFNIADISIVIGTALLVYILMRDGSKEDEDILEQ